MFPTLSHDIGRAYEDIDRLHEFPCVLSAQRNAASIGLRAKMETLPGFPSIPDLSSKFLQLNLLDERSFGEQTMFPVSLARFLALATLLALFTINSVHSAPTGNVTADAFEGLSHEAREILARATPAAPHWVAYSDKFFSSAGPPAPSTIKGYNVFVLSFLLLQGAWDNAQVWASLSASQRSSIKSQYSAAGIKLMVSAFGSTNAPTSSGADPVATANTMAAWVKKYGLDGIDVDYEDFNAMNAGNGKAEQWLISFTKQLRKQLPAGQYIITHAPVAPWFSPNIWGGGGYLKVHNTVGSSIDWVRFTMNGCIYALTSHSHLPVQRAEGASEYTTCAGLLTASSSKWPKSSLFQISASGVPINKLVIGKPATTASATNGYISPATLASCVSQAKGKGWIPRRDEFLDQDCQGFRFPGLVGTSQGDDETYSNNAKEANSDTIEDPTRHSTIDINLLLMYLGTHVLPSPRFTLKLIAPIVTHFYLWNI
ncbi:hypothetical protein NLI96_g6045 [Meripilus lineatus]|uniref:Chitinase n=1 Tax=Meripilus lineatus TaxID=2056292 RepID=A0AAD5V6M0_9APHY|nr:hypothetical protein NLI96_g6045 [Physisporinus lineatus]